MTAQAIPNCGNYLVELDKGTSTNGFILDSAVAGLLDSPYYRLDGQPDFQDVSTYVQRTNISRGRKNPFSEQSGEPSTCSITLNNNNFYFSVVNTASPYWNSITNRLGFELGTGVRVSRNGVYLFVGFITSLKQNVEMPNHSTVVISASDELFKANNVKLGAQTIVAERSDQRITKILDSVNLFVGNRALDTGVANLGTAPMDVGASVIDYLARINNSEQGRIFINKSGVFTMQSRVGRKLGNTVATLSDTGSNVKYQSFEIVNN